MLYVLCYINYGVENNNRKGRWLKITSVLKFQKEGFFIFYFLLRITYVFAIKSPNLCLFLFNNKDIKPTK